MRVVVLRTGWMARYAGVHPDDPKPIGGGGYNAENLGHERFNFAPVGRRVFGFVQTGKNQPGLNIRRVDPGADRTRALGEVLVIWVAPRPKDDRPVVVGWYRNATIYPELQAAPTDGTRDNCGYVASAALADAVLLPPDARTWELRKRSGELGQSLVRYSRDEAGEPQDLPWLSDVIARINAYAGPSLASGTEQEEQEAALEAVAAKIADRTGGRGGFVSNPALRRAIEERAMCVAIEHYRGLEWDVDPSVCKRHPFDLLCTRNEATLYVEVKGTTGEGDRVLVTANEVESARQFRTDLAVVRGIHVDTNSDPPAATGGRLEVVELWRPADESLDPIAYWFRRS